MSSLNSVGGASLTVSPTDFFTAWTLVDNTQPLPVELISFSGECNEDKIDISWSTATETNNALFNMYKSINSKDFEWIHSITGAFNSTQQIDYLYSDLNIIPGKNYQYKIEQVDVDGNSKTFNPIEVMGCKFHSLNTTVYFANETIILQNNSINDYSSAISVTNALGQLISTKNWNTRITGSKLEMPVKLSSGIYFVTILKEGVNETHKILVN